MLTLADIYFITLKLCQLLDLNFDLKRTQPDYLLAAAIIVALRLCYNMGESVMPSSDLKGVYDCTFNFSKWEEELKNNIKASEGEYFQSNMKPNQAMRLSDEEIDRYSAWFERHWINDSRKLNCKLYSGRINLSAFRTADFLH